MTHLPLTLGEYTTASGPETITRIGKGGKWAFDAQSRCWSVETGLYGKHFKNPLWNITGRVEPAPGQTITIKAFSLADDEKAGPKSPRELWMVNRDGGGFWFCQETTDPSAIRMIEAAPIETELARVTAERDEAVAASQALVVESARLAGCAEALRAIADLTEVSGMEFKRRHPALNSELNKRIQEHWYAVLSEFASSAFLAKIGAKPAEASNSQSDISTAHDALLALEMLKERQTGDSSGGSWSRGWDAGLDAAIKVVANLTEAKP